MKLEEAKERLLFMKSQLDELIKRNAEIDDSGIDDETASAISTVLQELDRLQKENEELSCVKKAIKVYKTNVGTENCQFVLMSESEFLNSFNYKCLLDDYISKDKIREKIELIKILRQALYNESNVITILQDLLKEE